MTFIVRIFIVSPIGPIVERTPPDVTAAQFSQVLKLLKSANTTYLTSVALGLFPYSDSTSKAARDHMVHCGGRGVKLEFEGDWPGLSHTLDKFPNLKSLRLLKLKTLGLDEISDPISALDLNPPLHGKYQSELKEIFPSLYERGVLHFR